LKQTGILASNNPSKNKKPSQRERKAAAAAATKAGLAVDTNVRAAPICHIKLN
jgi:DNA repair protein RadC